MTEKKEKRPQAGLIKLSTGIAGFDQLSGGGLPQHQTSLLIGGPGAGKTVFALQVLVHAARHMKQPGIFVTFEEKAQQIVTNAASFGWDLPGLEKNKLFFLDAHLSPAIVRSGEFDLAGFLAILKAKKEEMRAGWIVFDGIDVLLTLLQNPMLELQEIYRVREWLSENKLTAIITAKAGSDTPGPLHYGFMQFMVDCVIGINQRLERCVLERRLQIVKYRGSGFISGEYPVAIGPAGIEVGAPESSEIKHHASFERISAGFERLDAMLGGGLFRGSSSLITGSPGTSKTTLAAKFAEAACLRGEPTLFISFDEGVEPIVRNLMSVGIQFKPHLKSGLLRMYSGRAEAGSAEEHLAHIKALIDQHQPRCLVIDPLSAMARAGGLGMARNVANRLMYLAKDRMITVLLTALIDGDPQTEATELQISTIADTWIHLSYLVRSGERNRALTIVKSRGTCHSNQVRELILSSSGPQLTDVYSEGGEVLMGTLRWEKENEEKIHAARRLAEAEQQRLDLQFAEADIHAHIASLQRDLDKKRAELTQHAKDRDTRSLSSSERENQLRRIRGGDAKAQAESLPVPSNAAPASIAAPATKKKTGSKKSLKRPQK